MQQTTSISTPLGKMIASADDNGITYLKFISQLTQAPEHLVKHPTNKYLVSIINELNQYFDGQLFNFKTPLSLTGTEFQKISWIALMKVRYGTTISYSEQARSINLPKHCRAVANSNAINKIAIVIPCHRIINANGKLGGYNGGIERKEWLISHERKNSAEYYKSTQEGLRQTI